MNDVFRATGSDLLAAYDVALDEIYGYLLHRCGDVHTAEDLTSETFVAAARAVRLQKADDVSVPWLIGIARHKLVDHWRRQGREERALRAADRPAIDDPWPARLDELRAFDVLRRLAPQHRAALTLRYIDDLPVRDVAAMMDRTDHATEALLGRARAEFRRVYEQGGDDAV